MKKQKKLISVLLSSALAFGVLTAGPMAAGAAENNEGLEIIPTNVDTPSEGCVFVGVEGSYITQIQESLDLINSYRLEACEEGVINPSTGEPLTVDDYVPIKWSSDLEYVARIRAAESSITMAHARLNGESIWFTGPDSVFSSGEVIAWNGSKTMTAGIEQWYEEKTDWVNSTGNETGHYTQMINPVNTYVGLGTFCTEGGFFSNTTVGRFTRVDGLDETQGTAVDSCIQLLEVSTDYITDYAIDVDNYIPVGESGTCLLNAAVAYNNEFVYNPVAVSVISGVTWTSSNSDMPIDESSGVLTANAIGTTTVSASVSGITVAEVTVSNEVMLGDVNDDRDVDTSDATEIQKAVAQITSLTEAQQKAADVNGDNVIDITDATTIQKYVAQIITEFTAE